MLPEKDVWLSHKEWDEVSTAVNNELTRAKMRHSKVNRDLVRKDNIQEQIWRLERILERILKYTLGC